MIGLETFEETYDLARLIDSDAPCRLTLFPGLLDKPPIALFNPDSIPDNFIEAHNARQRVGSMGFYGVSNYIVGGEAIAKNVHGAIFYKDDVFPQYVKNSIEHDAISKRRQGALLSEKPDVKIVNELCASVNNYNDSVYGHFLVETMPKLYLLNILKSLGVQFKLLASYHLPDFSKKILGLYFPRNEIIYYDPTSEVVHPKRIIFPSMLNSNYFFHPLMNCFVSDAIARTSPNGKDTQPASDQLIYLSRSRLRPSYRRLENEPDVERVVTGLGFNIIHPEEMTIEQQIQIYRHSHVMISEYGSASHNSIFAPFRSKVAIINRVNSIQSRICALRGQKLLYIMPEDGRARTFETPEHDQNYTVEIEHLKRELSLLVAA